MLMCAANYVNVYCKAVSEVMLRGVRLTCTAKCTACFVSGVNV